MNDVAPTPASMKRTRFRAAIVLSVAVFLIGGATAWAVETSRISDEELASALALFDGTDATFLDLLSGVSDEAWDFRPAPDRWSVGQCAEHIVRSEAAMFDTARDALVRPADPQWQTKAGSKTDLLTNLLPNRGRRVQAPQEIRPTAGLSKDMVLALFRAQRASARALLRSRDLNLKAHLADNPFFGPLTAHQWLIYGPLHTERHMKQIREVMESEGYPDS